MQWEKRKPLWPKMAALAVLSLLALAAPSAWHNAELGTEVAPIPERATPAQASPGESDTAATRKELVRSSASSASLESPAKQSQPLPIQYEFNFDTLLSLRDTLLQMVEQLPEAPAQSAQPTQASQQDPPTPPVRVSSAHDRLAMLPARPHRVPRRQKSVLLRSTPARSAAAEESNFASILLEAARAPKQLRIAALTPKPQVAQPKPRIAMLAPNQQPSEQEIAQTTVPPTLSAPTLAEPMPVEPVPAEPVSAGPGPVTTQVSEVVGSTEAADVAAVDESPEDDSFEPSPPSAEGETEVAKAQPAALTHRPHALFAELEALSADSPGALWSQQVLQELRILSEPSTPGSIEPLEALAQLEHLQADAEQLLQQRLVPTYHSEWQQANQSLARRLPLWRVLLDSEQPNIFEASQSAGEKLLPVLNEIVDQLPEQDHGQQWREYLLIDDLADATSQGIERPTLARAKLAQEVLSRMEDPRLTDEQQQFLMREVFARLRQALRPWAASRVDLNILAALIERYEKGREARYAEVIAQLQQRLKWSDDATLQSLAEHLEQHYRGANMRIAVSDDLLNRMLPKQEPIVSPVSDRIAGSRVFGRARTTTQLRLRLVPEDEGWRFGLEAYGKVYSDTRSDTWPARVRNSALMEYEARKDIALDESGLHVSPTQAEADGTNRLVGVDSELDPVPILGRVLRDMAKSKHRKSRPLALRQARAKVESTAKSRMDTAVDSKVDVLEAQFRSRVLQPIEDLALLAEPLEMYTTTDRAVMKLRLANLGQLAAHTPRPLAPSDSLLSMQLHESAFNNAMMGLGLDGKRMKMIELFDFFAHRFGTPDAVPPEDMPRAATIEFAARDAVQVQCDGDRLQLILHVVELAHRRDRIRDFQIHVHFRPVLEGLDVKLVRDGTLQFSGRRLKTGPRIVLHSVIGKLIRDDQQITLLNEKVRSDPRFEGLMVTQLVIEDGWIGLALGPAHPRRTAWRAPVPELLKTPFVR